MLSWLLYLIALAVSYQSLHVSPEHVIFIIEWGVKLLFLRKIGVYIIRTCRLFVRLAQYVTHQYFGSPVNWETHSPKNVSRGLRNG